LWVFSRSRDTSEMMELHHVVPVACGGGDSPENLLLLCPNHHRLAHKLTSISYKRGAYFGPRSREEMIQSLTLVESDPSAWQARERRRIVALMDGLRSPDLGSESPVPNPQSSNLRQPSAEDARLIESFFYFVKNQKKRSWNTAEGYRRDLLKLSAIFSESGVALATASQADILAAVRSMIVNQAAPSSVLRMKSACRSFYSYLLRNKVVTENPTKSLRRRALRDLTPPEETHV
jgi:hypothetical protein